VRFVCIITLYPIAVLALFSCSTLYPIAVLLNSQTALDEGLEEVRVELQIA